MKYLNVKPHPSQLAGGRSVAPGEVVELTAEEAALGHNARLIRLRCLLPVPEAKPKDEPKYEPKAAKRGRPRKDAAESKVEKSDKAAKEEVADSE